MNQVRSIFLDFNLPNSATWFYFSLLLAVALFFKFSRLLSVRNWDVLALFLLVPGLLLRQEANTLNAEADVTKAPASPAAENGQAKAAQNAVLWYAYLWLLCGSAYWFIRCLADLALERRPALSPNLNSAGLAWLGLALLVCMIAVALRRPVEAPALAEAGNGTGDYVTVVWVRRILAIVCHVSVVAALAFIGYRHFGHTHCGVAAAAFYLLLPYTALLFVQDLTGNVQTREGTIQHVLPMALVLWAIAAYRLPMVSGLLLGLAAGSIYFPALLFPAWFSFYWRRGAGRFSCAFLLSAGLALGAIGVILWSGGPLADEVQSTLNVFDLQQFKQPTLEGFWTGVYWPYRIPVIIAFFAFVAGTLFWPAPKNLAHLLAISAALLIGIQIWFADRGGLYVLWYLPLLLLLTFRPNLADREAVRRSVKVPETAAPVQ